jgi:hypothetical protein
VVLVVLIDPVSTLRHAATPAGRRQRRNGIDGVRSAAQVFGDASPVEPGYL